MSDLEKKKKKKKKETTIYNSDIRVPKRYLLHMLDLEMKERKKKR